MFLDHAEGLPRCVISAPPSIRFIPEPNVKVASTSKLGKRSEKALRPWTTVQMRGLPHFHAVITREGRQTEEKGIRKKESKKKRKKEVRRKYTFTCCFVWVWHLISSFKAIQIQCLWHGFPLRTPSMCSVWPAYVMQYCANVYDKK
jgi:hypothetical protein